MTKDKALYAYFRKYAEEILGGEAYAATAVPNDVIFPYMTYDFIDADFDEGEVASTVNLWFRTNSEAVPNAAAAALKRYIEDNDLVECDGGAVWVKPGEPWSQALRDETDEQIKRRYINVTFEYLTR